ncbi:MAG: hypothetical protein AMJ43_08435 [Coxiella sp. DG_40]|nr:MAG: hypothetical protein AMJ43_08435 [Coxiella sp. DG_40]
MKTGRVSRIIQILTTLQSRQHYMVDDLAKMFETSRRTVFRDLKELQKIGVPYHFDQKNRCYTIEPGFFLPPLDLNLQEAMSLLLLVHKAGNQIQLPFQRSVLLAALKIENNLPSQIRQYCSAALQNISIRFRPQERFDLLDKIFAQLLKAILEKRIVNIYYYLPFEQKNVATNLSPYHLMYNDYTWYVLGKSSLHKEVCSFKLNQIKELNTLDKCFIKDKKFDVSDYLSRAWSMIPEGKLYHVKLRFLPEAARSVAEVQWHSTQKVTFEDDGCAIVEFRVDGLSEITWWILSYGGKVQVLTPRVLRQRIVEIAQNTAKQNKQLSSI